MRIKGSAEVLEARRHRALQLLDHVRSLHEVARLLECTLLHVYFVAIMLSALLEREVRSAMRRKNIAKIPILPEKRPTATPTTPRILENFADAAWHGFQEGDRSIRFPVELSPTAYQLLDLADVPRELYQ